jgi:transcriptional regulator of nitric oxide reductase
MLARKKFSIFGLIGLLCVVQIFLAEFALAGILTKTQIQAYFPDTILIGDKPSDLPAWPIYKEDGHTDGIYGWVFESLDLSPIPGFSGTPPNLLVALDRNGTFIDVRVISQNEPVFVGGLGPESLDFFVVQYKAKTLLQNMRVGGKRGGGGVRLDGVTKATASVKIIHETVLASALHVARAKLGFEGSKSAGEVAQVKTAMFREKSWQQLLADGDISHLRHSYGDIDRVFADTIVADVDQHAIDHPDEIFIDSYAANLGIPTIARNLLGAVDLALIADELPPNTHPILLIESGNYSFQDEDFIPGSVPELLNMRQGGLPITIRDLDLEVAPKTGVTWRSARVLGVRAQTGFDPSVPWQLGFYVIREKGQLFPERIAKEVVLNNTVSADYFEFPESESTAAWRSIWRERTADIAILSVGCLLLLVVLAQPKLVTRSPRTLRRFRLGYLVFTLFFIGWWAQGQLSIVNLTALIVAFRGALDSGPASFLFLLYDPITLIVLTFSLVLIPLWGRGPFCGWLCPFGALQELLAEGARSVGLKPLRLSDQLDRRLSWIKYLLLAIIVGGLFYKLSWSDRLVEIEPFKTAITLSFLREAPYVIYALALLFVSVLYYKAFCRYLCPLGAGMAILGRLRIFAWLPRREACGAPCQVCRKRCEYDAIAADGAIRYDDCFQCLDCVAVYDDPKRCPPLIKAARVEMRKSAQVKLATG